MIIVLRGADFSANNIGKIDVSNTLSVRTKEIASKFSKPLSDYTLFALHDLIDWLDSENILANMDGLYLPCLAGTLEESFINVAKSPFNIDWVPNSEIYELRSNGIRTKAPNTSGAEADALMVTSSAPVNDLHLLWFNTEEYTGENAFEPIYPFKGNNNYSWNKIDNGFVAAAPQSQLGGYELNSLGGGRKDNMGSITLNKSLKGINHKDVGNVPNILIYTPERRATTMNTSIDYSTLTNSMGRFSLSGPTSKTMIIPHGVISMGRGLTDEQVLQYNNLITALIDTL